MDTIATLGQLAESTGGMLISHTNDVRAGIARAVGDLRGYYEVAYSPSNRAFDGRFRKITLKVTPARRRGPDAQRLLRHAPGRGHGHLPLRGPAARGHALDRSPRASSRSTPARSASGGSRRPALHPRPGAPAQQHQARERPGLALERAHFSFMGVLRTSWGAVAEKFSQDSPVWLPRSKHAELMHGNAVFMRSFTVPEGRYRLETAALDQQSGRMTVEQSRLSVPPGRLPVGLSSLAVVKRAERVPERRPRLRRPVPGGRGPHRALGEGGGGGPGPAGGPLLRRLRPAGLHGDPAGHSRVPARQPGRGPCRADPAATRRRGPHPVRREPAGRDLRPGPLRGPRRAPQRARTASGSARPSGSPGRRSFPPGAPPSP